MRARENLALAAPSAFIALYCAPRATQRRDQQTWGGIANEFLDRPHPGIEKISVIPLWRSWKPHVDMLGRSPSTGTVRGQRRPYPRATLVPGHSSARAGTAPPCCITGCRQLESHQARAQGCSLVNGCRSAGTCHTLADFEQRSNLMRNYSLIFQRRTVRPPVESPPMKKPYQQLAGPARSSSFKARAYCTDDISAVP